MITTMVYIALENFTQGWSGWLMVLPVLSDLVLIRMGVEYANN